MSSETEFQGARFHRCALQVNPASYARYKGQESMEEGDYNQKILQQCKENDIKLVGLANHGNADSSEMLRSYLRKNDIAVLPGFEIASSEKIHMVCLYPEDTSITKLNQYLGQLMESNSKKLEREPTHPSSLSCEEIAKKILQEQDGFWYASHATGQNGLLRLTGAGDNYAHLWKKDDLVIAVQIPGLPEDVYNTDNSKKYWQIIKNNTPEYLRSKPIVVINAKDVVKPEDLSNPSASCQIKMTECTFDSFKNAFKDPESRIRLNQKQSYTPHSYIESIQWSGPGFFENRYIALSENLNAVIGGRGTGKSTLIESIRYVLDLQIRINKKMLEKFLQNTLHGSQVTITVRSKTQYGNQYTISRRYGEQPIVKNPQGEVSSLSPADILPDIELLGQNEILEIERNEEDKLKLVNRFLPDSHKFDTDMNELKRRLLGNRERLLKAIKDFDDLEGKVNQEGKIKERIEQFVKLGIEKKLKASNSISKEKSIVNRVTEQFSSLQTWLDDYKEIFDLDFLHDANIKDLPGEEHITKIREVLIQMKERLDNFVDLANNILKDSRDHHGTLAKNWEELVKNIEEELQQAISQLPNQAGKSGTELGREYTEITAQLIAIDGLKRNHASQEALIQEIDKERQTLLEDYRQTAFRRFAQITKKTKKLNQGDLKGKLKIKVTRCGNKEALLNFLEQQIEGVGRASLRWLEGDDCQIDLMEWAKWIKNKDTKAFLNAYKSFGLASGTATKICSLSDRQRLELQEIELTDRVDIELNVSYKHAKEDYVALDRLSIGQKCTALLNLLLLNRDAPLIIDQPEDNLDNAFIAERIVQDLRQFKTNRQFLFATHNANIPIFGDAELIALLDIDAKEGRIQHLGSIDKKEIRERAAEILEGGRAAFDMRKEKYGF